MIDTRSNQDSGQVVVVVIVVHAIGTNTDMMRIKDMGHNQNRLKMNQTIKTQRKQTINCVPSNKPQLILLSI